MANQEIINYIKQSLGAGYSVETIRQTLIEQGWLNSDVDEAFAAAKAEGTYAIPDEKKAQPTEKPKRPALILVIGILGILGSILEIASGALVLSASSMLGALGGSIGNVSRGAIQPSSAGALASLVMVIGIAYLVLGIITLMAFILLLKMRRKGMIMVVVLEIIAVALSVFSYISSGKIDLLSMGFPVLLLVLVIAERKKFV